MDHDVQGRTSELGYQIMKKFGFSEEICYQSLGHHEDKPKTIEAVIVKAADAISEHDLALAKTPLELYISDWKNLKPSQLRSRA